MKRNSKTDIQLNLLQTAQINMQIEAKLEEISYWRKLASKAESVYYSDTGGTKGSGGRKNSKIEDCVCKIVTIEDSLKKDMDKLFQLKKKISDTINRVQEPECKTLLIHRYLCGKTWEKIAEDMGYSYVHVVHRLHPKALKKISDLNS